MWLGPHGSPERQQEQPWSLVLGPGRLVRGGLVAVFIVFAASKYVYNTLEIIMYVSFVVANIGLLSSP